MRLLWTSEAHSDVTRLHEFLAPVNTNAAVRVVRILVAALSKLAKHPRMGERLEEFDPREVPRIFPNVRLGDFEWRLSGDASDGLGSIAASRMTVCDNISQSLATK
jgi:plasmid stabilization system protein ParE